MPSLTLRSLVVVRDGLRGHGDLSRWAVAQSGDGIPAARNSQPQLPCASVRSKIFSPYAPSGAVAVLPGLKLFAGECPVERQGF